MAAEVKPGSCIRNERLKNMMGTLGCLVCARGARDTHYLLTAGHVIGASGYAEPGDAIQALVRGEWLKIAEFTRSTKLRDAVGVYQECDAAIARITAPEMVSPEIEGIGFPAGRATGVWEGMEVRLRGALTGIVSTTVDSSGNELELEYEDPIDHETLLLHFKGQILYGADSPTGWLTGHGDSGALVVNANGRAVGLHIAKTPSSYRVMASVCTPIQVVLDTLEVDLLDAPGASVLPPGIRSAAAAPAVDVTTPKPDDLGRRRTGEFDVPIVSLLFPHTQFGGAMWQLTEQGLVVDGKLDRTRGEPVTVWRVWSQFGVEIRLAAVEFRVPVELIIATICTESGGDRDAVRKERGWLNERDTPKKISVGLMQTLLSSAQEALDDFNLNVKALRVPQTSIRAGTAFIKNQRTRTAYDPPLVACAYNAGSLRRNDSPSNRWKIYQYPPGTGKHADRFVEWFNDCFALFDADPAKAPIDVPSFWRQLRGDAP